MKIDELLDKSVELSKTDPKEYQKELFQAVLETTKWQVEKCALYRQMCKQKNFDPRRDLKSVGNFKDIPYLTTVNFKKKKGHPKEFLCVPENEIRVWFMSSGTSGDQSTVGRDYLNLVRYRKNYCYFTDHVFDSPDPQWALMFFPPVIPHHTFEEKGPIYVLGGVWGADVLTKTPVEKRVYALRFATEAEAATGKKFIPDLPELLTFLRSNPAKKGAGMVTASAPLLYGIMNQIYSQTGETFDLGEKVTIVTGGGWKTFAGQEVTPETFRALMKKVLNIPEQNVRDGYTFSEMDEFFGECEYHNKHAPPYADVIVRDFDTLKPVKTGEKGLMNIINPIAHGYAGVSILQDDVVRIVMDDGCPCGRRGKVIEVLGRAKGIEARGCGAQVVEETKM